MTAAQDRGREFEADWGDLIGEKPVRGSGNQWFAKLDIRGGQFLWSLKHTDKASITIRAEDIEEARAAVQGPHGVGLNTMYGMALSIQGYRCVLLPDTTFLTMVEEEVKFITPSKSRRKRTLADMTQLERRALAEEV